MSKFQVFASFDEPHDEDLRERLERDAAAPGSLFDLVGWSSAGPITDAWLASARSRIAAADEMVVICSEHSAGSERMAVEMSIATEEGIPCLLLWGRRDEMCTKPAGAKRDAGMYAWTRDVYDNQLAATARQAKELDIPENLKRRQP